MTRTSGPAGPSAAEAHAKINLRHRVFGRDETGYHAVETILARTSLCDTLVLEEGGDGISIAIDGPMAAGVPGGADNLCWQAADLFLRRAFAGKGPRPAVRLRLTKRIPMGSGLGGGSADAAATLRLLASRWEGLSERDLVSIAGRLGSDVPFALISVPLALGWERGRRLLPLRPPRARPALLLCPPIHVATPDAYRWLHERRVSGTSRAAPEPTDPAEAGRGAGASVAVGGDQGGAAVLPGATRLAAWESLARLTRNDLELAVVSRHPMLGEALRRLRACGPTVAGMTGSGSALFGVFTDEDERERSRRTLEKALPGQSRWPTLDVQVPV